MLGFNMFLKQKVVRALIVTYCTVKFSLFMYACCVSCKGPRGCCFEITLVTVESDALVFIFDVVFHSTFM